MAQQDILTYKGPDREQKLLDGAKKEGQVVFYSAMIVNQALRPIVDAFEKKYPFVKVTYWRGETEDIVAKLSAEERANNVVGDLIEGTGVGELAVSAGFLTPYYSPSIDEYPAAERDPNNLWTPTRLSYFSAAYNTKLVPADKMPKTYEALLDPQWKGKMAWRIGTASGTPLFITNLRLAWGEDKAMAYFKKLAQQKIINFGSGSARTLVDRVIAGEYPIALQHLRASSADQQSQGRAGQFAIDGSGADDGGNHGHSEGRASSLCRHAARRFHSVQGRPADHGEGRVFSGAARRAAAAAARSGRPEKCRRAGKFHQSGQAAQIYREFGKDISKISSADAGEPTSSAQARGRRRC